MQYTREGTKYQQQDYTFFNEQYATSTHQKDHDMNPSLIVQPKGDDDVVKTILWAQKNNVAVAVKSGGHQYSGASSTGGKNIQLDLSNTYKDMMVFNPNGNTDKTYVYAGVSNQLKDFNAYLTHNGLFVPHGQCAYVCVGGHAQTGGYGQLGRSFGLFGDHIRTIRMFDYNGKLQEVTKDSDAELFYAILGGSPGNFGIITHYVVEVHQATDYMGTVVGPNKFKGPHYFKGLWLYSPDVLKQLLTYVAKMSDDANFPRNYDLCVSVLSTDFPVSILFPELADASVMEKVLAKIKSHFADEFLSYLNGRFPAIIVVYAQWCPFSKTDVYDTTVDNWFAQFRALGGLLDDLSLSQQEADSNMADITGLWIFPKEREFNLPYVKRTYATNMRNLSTNGWVDTVVQRLDLIYNENNYLQGNEGERGYERYLSCKLSVQIQNYGGKFAKFTTNKDNGTSYSWRDSSMVQTLDCFHNDDDKSKAYAEQWAAKNDTLMNGASGLFSPVDKRVLWGSWGDWNLGDEKVWKCYYEDEAMYQKVGAQRAKWDPNGTFTPNPFAVTAFKG
ncbi:hypothetical protein H072_8364 [Dactylellina haptotyla CBS 200.50]|uniref:FAD-binding PCMH-type domain-containing protein n=1 Tax=Dactylellina haptotyla (strain CBS 200.50) TaxID=1284197 RepID=S8BF65_DACHA|nr:hypothetical protein H072_8364 [Dactylellina haptotyla CBS 200.50]